MSALRCLAASEPAPTVLQYRGAGRCLVIRTASVLMRWTLAWALPVTIASKSMDTLSCCTARTSARAGDEAAFLALVNR